MGAWDGGHSQGAELLDVGLEVGCDGLERADLRALLCEGAVGLGEGGALCLDVALAVLCGGWQVA